MKPLTELTIGLVALIQGMFLWHTHAGQSISESNAKMAAKTSTLAANQWLYNDFLTSGLVWSLYVTEFSIELRVYFLGCVVEGSACLAHLPSAVFFFRSSLTRYSRAGTGAVWVAQLRTPHDLSI